MTRRGLSILQAACAVALVSIFATTPAWANVLVNGGFNKVGPSGSPVVVVGPNTVNSAALGWVQWATVPGSTLTTALVLSTDPAGGGYMLHVTTNSGHSDTQGFGSGFGQYFTPFAGAVASFDILVVSGQVTAGLVEGNDAGPFAPNVGTFGPQGTWQHFTEDFSDPAKAIFFETLTFDAGAEYYVDNVRVKNPESVPEPSTLMLVVGVAALTFVARKRAAS